LMGKKEKAHQIGGLFSNFQPVLSGELFSV
jgi:hypothetical protein